METELDAGAGDCGVVAGYLPHSHRRENGAGRRTQGTARRTTEHTDNIMERNTKRLTAILMAALMVAAVAPAFAAPGSIDGSQTDTSDDVYVSADKTMDATFNASGDADWNLTVDNVSDSADLAMNVSKSGTDYYAFSGTFSNYNDGDPDADSTTSGEYHAFSDSELDDVPMTINENVSLNVTYWNASADSPTPTTVTVYVENTDERSVQEATEGNAAVDLFTAEQPLYRGADEYDAVEIDDRVTVNGTETNVIYTLTGSNVTEPFQNYTEDVDSQGTFLLMKSEVDADTSGEVPVFYRSSPDWYDAEDLGSYMVYDDRSDTLTLHSYGPEFDSTTENVDVTASSDVYRVTDVYTVYKLAGGYSNDGISAVMDMVM